MIPQGEIAGWSREALSRLYWDGIVQLPWRLSPDQMMDIYKHLIVSHHYPAHVVSQGDGKLRTYADSQSIETTSHRMEDVISAPHLLEFALSFTDFAGAYLGEPPRLYSVNGFWTRPGRSAPDPNIQIWHRDRDDRKFLALFIYGTDVLTDEDGPHLFARGSHKNSDGLHRQPGPNEPVEKVFGKAGSAFFASTDGLHCGLKPRTGERLLLWARWGVSERPASYGWDKTEPVPVSKIPLVSPWTPRIEQSASLVVDWAA